jgi:hypothetical protein
VLRGKNKVLEMGVVKWVGKRPDAKIDRWRAPEERDLSE